MQYPSTCPSAPDGCSSIAYDEGVMRETLVTDFDLVCDRLPLLPTIGSSYMSGVVIATMTAGFLADRFGRRSVMLAMYVSYIQEAISKLKI